MKNHSTLDKKSRLCYYKNITGDTTMKKQNTVKKSETKKSTEQSKVMPLSEQLEDIGRKIQKLMSLGSSPNEHEAARALEMANALLLKYNLEMDEIEKQGFQWKILLANDIAQHNFCRLIVGHRNRRLYFVGRKTNVARGKACYTMAKKLVRMVSNGDITISDAMAEYKTKFPLGMK